MQRPKEETGGFAVACAGGGELSQVARQALAEAEERRRPGACAFNQPAAGKEINGRGGPEPVRYGDWEVKGIASDF
jgi:hypothetical protein